MATEETTISDLELTEDILPDMLTPVENASETKATTFSAIKNWLSGFFISKTGKENIEGQKTFRDNLTVTKNNSDQAYIQIDNNNYTINTGTPNISKYSGYVFRDKNSAWLGFMRWGHNSKDYNSIQISCFTKSGSGSNAILEIGFDPQDKAFLKTQNITLDATDNTTKLATTAWVRQYGAQVNYAAGITVSSGSTASTSGLLVIIESSGGGFHNGNLKINSQTISSWTGLDGSKSAGAYLVKTGDKIEFTGVTSAIIYPFI